MKPTKTIEVLIHLKDEQDEVIRSEQVAISGTMYELLMSENPSFAPNKPQNEYREVDIWYIVDLIRGN
ncbi:hypothetical protein [Paenibacillus sp. IITD108]|uniref:hypothetical protein n=1 Tax=Paenibacillus sp. IITD108 TaxID=3116649 RepID=UPI002F42DB99